jgi:hypothetical protein
VLEAAVEYITARPNEPGAATNHSR